MFTLCNSVAKTLVLLKYYLLERSNKEKSEEAIKSLWKGTIEGLKIIIGFQ